MIVWAVRHIYFVIHQSNIDTFHYHDYINFEIVCLNWWLSESSQVAMVMFPKY